MGSFGKLRRMLVLLTVSAAAACQPLREVTRTSTADFDRDCEIVTAVARDSLQWGDKHAEPLRLIDMYDYLPRCDWRASNLPQPDKSYGRLIAIGKPLRNQDGNKAIVPVSYVNGGGGLDIRCATQRFAGAWKGEACISINAPNGEDFVTWWGSDEKANISMPSINIHH